MNIALELDWKHSLMSVPHEGKVLLTFLPSWWDDHLPYTQGRGTTEATA